jgi:hypothetical protein
MTTLFVGGAVANKYLNGGEAWVRLSWIRGLERLGFRVHFIEQIDASACVDRSGAAAPFERSAPRAYFDRVMDQFGLTGSATLVLGDGRATSGLAYEQVLDLAAEAELLVNISGNIHSAEILSRIKRKAYVDLDPGFTQFWHAAGNPGARLKGHDTYFTVGENIGSDFCPIPTSGIDWRAVPPPVVLDDWPPGDASPGVDTASRLFTTVGAWRSAFGPVEHGGRTYGLKVHEFRKVIELPRRVPDAEFEIALDIHPGDAKDRRTLIANGWRLADPREEVPGPIEFRRYVQRSGAEFSVAQGVYVDTGSGWFSDRTVRYLASGKPALVQDTGFSRNYRVGEGLVPFRTLDEAAAGARRIVADYETHARAARALAVEHFDSDTVLRRFLADALH